MKRTSWLRLGLWIGVPLVGLAAAAILALGALGPALTRERIEAGLAGALGRPVRVGAVHFQPWLVRLWLADVEVAGEPADSAVHRLRAPRVDVSIAVSSVWRRQVVLSIHVHSLDLAIEVSAGPTARGSPFPLPETFALGPVEARLGSIRATGARVSVHDPQRGLAVEATGADATAQPASGDLDVRLDVERLRVDAAGVREEAARVVADGRLAADRVELRRLAWRWHDRPTAVDGRVRDPWGAAPELALRATGELPVAAVAKLAGVDAALGGIANVAARVEGPLGAPRIGGRVSAAPLAVGGTALDEVTVDARWEASSLRLESIQARLGAGRLAARGTVEPLLAGSPTRVAVEVTELTLPAPLGSLRGGSGAIHARMDAGALELTRARVTWRAAALALEGRADARGVVAGHASPTADLSALDVSPKLRPAAGGSIFAASCPGASPLRSCPAVSTSPRSWSPGERSSRSPRGSASPRRPPIGRRAAGSWRSTPRGSPRPRSRSRISAPRWPSRPRASTWSTRMRARPGCRFASPVRGAGTGPGGVGSRWDPWRSIAWRARRPRSRWSDPRAARPTSPSRAARSRSPGRSSSTSCPPAGLASARDGSTCACAARPSPPSSPFPGESCAWRPAGSSRRAR